MTVPKVKGALLLLGLVGLALGLRWSGALDGLSAELLRARVAELGWLGPVVFVGLYPVAIVAHVPGALLVGASVLAWGPLGGFLLSYLGANASNLASFLAIRFARPELRVGPTEAATGPLARIQSSPLWARLEERPYLVTTLVRTAFPTAAVVTLALALSGVSWRPYTVGSMLGILPQLLATVGAFSIVLSGV